MALPLLPFGESGASLRSDVEAASETMAAVVPSMQVLPTGPARNFRMKLAACRIDDVRMVASGATPCRMEVEESQGWHLVVPYVGGASLRCNGKEFSLRPGVTALMLPNMRRSTERAPGSVAIASFDAERLKQTRAVMTGDMSNLDERPVALHLGHRPGMFAAFTQICRLIDRTADQGELAGKLGVADTIYRWMALVLEPDDAARPPGSARASALDVVCDLIRAMPERPLTLTALEAASGLSARSLQSAFKARFGCSPMEWQRRERILELQHRLSRAGPDETITSLAHAMGFSSSAAFTTMYKRYVGETPSQTRNRFR